MSVGNATHSLFIALSTPCQLICGQKANWACQHQNSTENPTLLKAKQQQSEELCKQKKIESQQLQETQKKQSQANQQAWQYKKNILKKMETHIRQVHLAKKHLITNKCRGIAWVDETIEKTAQLLFDW